jgi:hypothetical protein
MTAWLIACGEQADTPALDEGEPVAGVTQASSNDDQFIDRAPIEGASKLAKEFGKLSDEAAKVANVIGKVGAYGQMAVSALQMLGYLETEDQILQKKFDAIHTHLDQIGVRLVEVDLAIERDQRLSLMRTAVNTVNIYANRGGGRIDESLLDANEIDQLGNALWWSQYAAQNATEISAHQGYYYEASTNGDRCTGSTREDWFYDYDCWKHYVPGRPGDDRSIAYDWRLGTTEMLMLIASRLAIIGITEPDFRNSGERMAELSDYLQKLEDYHSRMTQGIQCGHVPGITVQVWCADIHTGLHMSTTFVDKYCNQNYDRDKCDALAAPHRSRMTRSLMTQLPLFQVRSMINSLHNIMSNATELTTNPRIRLWDSQECLYSAPAYEYETNPYEPTVIPGQWGPALATCNGGVDQEWHYDRATGEIKNAWGACLSQRSFDLNHPYWQGSMWVKACANEGGEHWTYDPWSGVLESAFHTVLGTNPLYGTWGPTIVKAELPDGTMSQAWNSPPLDNLALNKPSWQSSTGWGGVAARANDGNIEGNYWYGSVSHTLNGLVYPGQWHMAGQHWYVYLSPNFGPERHVKRIKIYNRTDCCSERLSHYNVLAWISADEEWRVISDHSNDTSAPPVVELNVDVLTRYVMIAKTNDDYLQLAEVEVSGY